jgi:hypothetical protein
MFLTEEDIKTISEVIAEAATEANSNAAFEKVSTKDLQQKDIEKVFAQFHQTLPSLAVWFE